MDLISLAMSNTFSPRIRVFSFSCSDCWVCGTYDLERVGDNSDSHELLSVVTAVHHERVGEALDDGALGLPEALDSIAAGGVRYVDRRADLDVVAAIALARLYVHVLAAPNCSLNHAAKPKRERAGAYVREMSRISTSS